ncbi:hypothetical protein BH09BAC4_BH09BAC4_24560 [soil metagenome]
MKNPFIFSLSGILLFTGIMACQMENNPAADRTGDNTDTVTTSPAVNRVRIRIGASTFSATLLDNPTVTAFKARLPITVSMSDLNGNEKFYNFTASLPINSSNPRSINTGDLMLYGSTTLVLFYETFSTSYSYTRLGRIENPAGLSAALGSGNVTVTFEIDG